MGVKVVRREEENREAGGLIQKKGLWRDFFLKELISQKEMNCACAREKN